MLVLGIDPGTATTGYGLVADDGVMDKRGGASRALTPTGAFRLVECGVIRTRARDTLATRLLEVHEGVAELLVRHRPDLMAVEDVFYARNVRTTVVLGHARGVVLLAGAQAGVEIREFPPAAIKKAVVGTGSATKEQVQFMLTRLLRLRAAPQPADAADGVAAALTALLGATADRLRAEANRNGSRVNAPPRRTTAGRGSAR